MRKIAVVVVATSLSSAAAFSACGGDDDIGGGDAATGAEASASSSSSSSSGGPGDGGTTCAAYAEAVCNRAARCTPLAIDVVYGNLDACKQGHTILCERSTHAPGAPPVNAACIDALATGCGDFVPGPACAVKGSLTDGTPCELDGQCASGRCGGAGGTPGCGLCRAASDASILGTPAGGGCDNEGECVQGLSCLDASSDFVNPTRGTCQTTRALGEACGDTEDCNTGSHGDFGWMGYTVACLDGGCAKPLDEGTACPPRPSAYACDVQKKLRCELVVTDGGFSGVCIKWPFAKATEPCTKNNQTPSGTCYGDLLCVGDGGAGHCVLRPAVGEPCLKDHECRFGLSCVDGLCAIPPADRCK